MSNNTQQPFEIVCEQTKYQILNAVNQIAMENNLPAFITTMILKEIALESSNNSMGTLFTTNKLVSNDDYKEFLKFKDSTNDMEE